MRYLLNGLFSKKSPKKGGSLGLFWKKVRLKQVENIIAPLALLQM
jgi:hypothetical protein